ncbi:hypothetical protein ACFWIA_02445 [Streptomyces sp. NPDC127068]|uniref:hypothetical protein n=1 Tax=Streptomyces sp. NPDC127068 TaxID=3347127 RepID=UPI00366765B3
MVSDRLGMTPQGRAAQVALGANPPDETTAAAVQDNARTVLLAEVERDPELLSELSAALHSLTPSSGGPNHGVDIRGTRNRLKGVNVVGGDQSIIHKNPLAAWLAIAGLLAVLAVGGYLLSRSTDDAGTAEPLDSAALTQKVLPSGDGLPRGWEVTHGPEVEKCPPERNCQGAFAQAESEWDIPEGGTAGVQVIAFTSSGAASDVYAQIVRELKGDRKLDIAQIGNERVAVEQDSSTSSDPEFEAFARTDSVLVRVVTSGESADTLLPRLLRTSVERADQAQQGKEPDAAMN